MTGQSDFWSRRKAKVAAEEEALAREAEAPAPETEDLSDEEILAELELPDPDSLEPGDDFSRFMAAAVPERLRRRALRRLWRSNPTLANLDALVDYGGDFTDTGVGAGIVATTYQVGRGMTRHIEELARQAEAEAKAEAAEQDPEAEAASDPIALTEAEPDPEPETETETEFAEAEPQQTAQPPRRMKFQFAV